MKCHQQNRKKTIWGISKIILFSLTKLFKIEDLFKLSLSFLLLIGLVACSGQTKLENETETTESSTPGEEESKLTFFDVTLEQADDTGKPIWKVEAKQARYAQEKQIAEVEKPYGELYQDGKVVYRVKAQKANIKQDGKQLFLEGNIVATDPKTGAILKGNELEWRPQEDLLIVRKQLNGIHKQVRVVAKEARVKTREQRMELFGGVVANSNEPKLQLRTEELTWKINEEKLLGKRPIQIDRYKNNRITDRGRGNSAEVNLKTKVVSITKNGQLELLEPPIQIASDYMNWNLNSEIVDTKAPVTVVHNKENMTVTADRGKLELPKNTVYLTGNVNGVGQRNQSIKSQNMTWYLDKELVEAQGNVIYRQADPPLTFSGDKASGNLEQQNILVSGGAKRSRVITEVIPQPKP